MSEEKNEVEVVKGFETWKHDEFKTTEISIIQPNASLDSAGRITYYHRVTMEAGKVSIAAALMAALELYRVKNERQGDVVDWCEANLPFKKTTVYRYLTVLEKSFGNKGLIYDLSHDTEVNQLAAVYKYTNYTNYQSLYQLYNGEGIVKKSKLGGAGRGQGRKRKQSAEELAKQAEAVSNALTAEATRDCVAQLYCLGITQGGFGEMNDTDLKGAIDTLESVLQKAKEIIKSRRSKTLSAAFEKEL